MAMCVRVLTLFRKATLRAIRLHGLVGLLVAVCVLAFAASAGAAESQGRFPARSLSAEALSPGGAQVQPASAAGLSFSLTPTDAEPAAVCPSATRGRYECESILVPTVKAKTEAEAQYLFGLDRKSTR